jgi:uncharacterized protein (DUF342 family)
MTLPWEMDLKCQNQALAGPMTEKKSPRVLILENDEAISSNARSLLVREGFDVLCEKISKNALEQLQKSKSSPFSLFIVSSILLEMDGDEVLKNAKIISPMTQQMLLIPADKPDLAISAINKGGINSCILHPFTDKDLIYQTKRCIKLFYLSMKHEQIRKVSGQQNKKMFQIAQKLKKKEQAYQKLIGEKKAEKLMLRSKQRKARKLNGQKGDINLENRMDLIKIPVKPQTFQTEFFKLCDYIKALFDSTASRTGLEPIPFDLLSIFAKESQKILPNEPNESGEPNEKSDQADLIEKIIQTALTSPDDNSLPLSHKKANKTDKGDETDKEDENIDTLLESYIKVSFSTDETKAYIHKIKELDSPELLSLSNLLDLLHKQAITYGIIEDKDIEAWIAKLGTDEDKLIAAKGDEPDYGEDGHIAFHFKKDYSNPGKIMEDGSIDFRDRGEIPHVQKGDLLAKKTPAREGKDGMSVTGTPIPVKAPLDPVFIAGSGTSSSEDGLSIYAAMDGQPHVDAMGNITINPELMIKGDVDYETGNIDFKGNIIVTGTIKEGFTVKGLSLTAKEIEGAVIDLSGNLYISAGITEAKISTQGIVHAKFINDSTIKGFGDLIIQKEIIDSNILISGKCENTTGHIISSKIIAKNGIESGKIGTASSKPVTLKVGVDEHIETLTRKVDEQLQESVARLQELREKIKKIETRDQELYGQITQKAQIQEACQNEIKKIEKTIPDLIKNSDLSGEQKALAKIKKLSEKVEAAKKELNNIFETQDKYAKEIDILKNQTNEIEKTNKNHIIKKRAIKEFAAQTQSLPQVIIQGKVTQDTVIQGPNASLTLREDLSRCKIQENTMKEDGLNFYEMSVSDL